MAIEKLKITPCSETGGPKGGSFNAYINPEQITHNRTLQVADKPALNTSGNPSQVQGYNNETVSFDLYLDGTGVVDNKTIDVEGQIKALDRTIMEYKGEEHKPNYLLLEWPGIQMVCHCTTFNITYTMFKANGKPLRAKVSLTFQRFWNEQLRKAASNNSSPDLSHVKTIREGDRLPLLCKEVYGDYIYFQQVAEFNGLTNFRDIAVGTQLVFPPLDK